MTTDRSPHTQTDKAHASSGWGEAPLELCLQNVRELLFQNLHVLVGPGVLLGDERNRLARLDGLAHSMFLPGPLARLKCLTVRYGDPFAPLREGLTPQSRDEDRPSLAQVRLHLRVDLGTAGGPTA